MKWLIFFALFVSCINTKNDSFNRRYNYCRHHCSIDSFYVTNEHSIIVKNKQLLEIIDSFYLDIGKFPKLSYAIKPLLIIEISEVNNSKTLKFYCRSELFDIEKYNTNKLNYITYGYGILKHKKHEILIANSFFKYQKDSILLQKTQKDSIKIVFSSNKRKGYFSNVYWRYFKKYKFENNDFLFISKEIEIFHGKEKETNLKLEEICLKCPH